MVYLFSLEILSSLNLPGPCQTAEALTYSQTVEVVHDVHD